MEKGEPPVVVEQNYQASVEQLWQAITVADQMRAWYFDVMEAFEPTVGFETGFDVEHDGKTYPHRWSITEVDPPCRLVYRWQIAGIPGDGRVIWEVSPRETGSQLRLTYEVIESFPQDDPAFKRESAVEGWIYLISTSLKTFLDGE